MLVNANLDVRIVDFFFFRLFFWRDKVDNKCANVNKISLKKYICA